MPRVTPEPDGALLVTYEDGARWLVAADGDAALVTEGRTPGERERSAAFWRWMEEGRRRWRLLALLCLPAGGWALGFAVQVLLGNA